MNTIREKSNARKLEEAFKNEPQKRLNYFLQLKIAKSTELNKSFAETAPVKIGEAIGSEGKDKGDCVCRKYDLIWGNKVSCEFRKKVVEISKELWADNYLDMANNLMAVFQWESGGTFKANVPNIANSGGTGLIQFMPSTAKSLLGKDITIETTTDYWGRTLKRVKEFAEMTEVEQLDYVKKYFKPMKNKKVEFIDFYLQVLFPTSSLKDDHIVFAESLEKLTTRTDEKQDLKDLRVRAYSQNDGLDTNKDGVVWKSEIAKQVQKYVVEGRANKAKFFECGKCDNKGENKYISPVADPYVTSHFSTARVHPVDGTTKAHNGVDLKSSSNALAIVSPCKLTITTIKYKTDGKAGGNRVYGNDSYGYIHCFMHLADDSIVVTVGQTIEQKATIGTMGNTGVGTGIHLHYEMRTSWNADGAYDPLDLNDGLIYLKNN